MKIENEVIGEIAVAVVEEITVNKKGKIIDESICG